MTQDQPIPVDSTDSAEADVARRSVLRGALALGAVGLGGALGGCGSKSSDTASHDTVSSGSTSSGSSTGGSSAGAGATSAPTTPTPAATSGGTSGSAGAGNSLGPASAIPSGGGQVFTSQKIVVTQPSMGSYKAFSAVCTHQSCTVGDVSDGTINCPCHGSKFSISDGSVVRGPATQALAAKTVTVTDGNISVA
jgi:nitrite reductase/ring-hydroxylating ferredoxin subunit